MAPMLQPVLGQRRLLAAALEVTLLVFMFGTCSWTVGHMPGLAVMDRHGQRQVHAGAAGWPGGQVPNDAAASMAAAMAAATDQHTDSSSSSRTLSGADSTGTDSTNEPYEGHHHLAADHTTPHHSQPRTLLAAAALVVPASASNGSTSVAFPNTTFAAWCAADDACTSVVSEYGAQLTVQLHADPWPYLGATANWPTPFSGPQVATPKLASAGVVELQMRGYSAKQSAPICDAATPCSATLTVPLGSVDASKEFVCMRLQPDGSGGYQAVGYPDGTYGLQVVGIITNNALRCSTTSFGLHIVVQYTAVPVQPPSPPPSPPSPPAPPSPPDAAISAGGISVRFRVNLTVGFDTLKANEPYLEAMTSSLERTLADNLVVAMPALLLDGSRSHTAYERCTIEKISRMGGSLSGNNDAVVALFLIVAPQGTPEAFLQQLRALLTANTSSLFRGSHYSSLVRGPAEIEADAAAQAAAAGSSDGGVSMGDVVAAVVCGALGLALVAALVLAAQRWHMYLQVLPKGSMSSIGHHTQGRAHSSTHYAASGALWGGPTRAQGDVRQRRGSSASATSSAAMGPPGAPAGHPPSPGALPGNSFSAQQQQQQVASRRASGVNLAEGFAPGGVGVGGPSRRASWVGPSAGAGALPGGPGSPTGAAAAAGEGPWRGAHDAPVKGPAVLPAQREAWQPGPAANS